MAQFNGRIFQHTPTAAQLCGGMFLRKSPSAATSNLTPATESWMQSEGHAKGSGVRGSKDVLLRHVVQGRYHYHYHQHRHLRASEHSGKKDRGRVVCFSFSTLSYREVQAEKGDIHTYTLVIKAVVK